MTDHDNELPLPTDGPTPPEGEALPESAQTNEPEESPEEREARRKARLIQIQEDLERLRGELNEYRRSHYKLDASYEKVTDDPEYQYLLQHGGYYVQEDDGLYVKRIYPTLDEIFKTRPSVVRDADSINWKAIDNKVYIKEFMLDEEQLQAELAHLKSGKAEPIDIKASINEAVSKLKVDLPEEMRKDFENVVGMSLTLKVGVMSILLSIIIGYNYLISAGSVPKEARVVVGAFVGVTLFGLSYYLYKKQVSVVSILVGAGLLALYYTVYVAIHDYRLFSPWQAFTAAIIITASAVVFSLWYNRRDLSIMAIFGGYITPFLASTAGDTYLAFLSYLFLLNIGMLTIAYLRNWRTIHFISFVATLVFLAFWMVKREDGDLASLVGLMVFATLFHITFFVMTVIFDLKQEIQFTSFDFWVTLVNTLFYLVWTARAIQQFPDTGPEEVGIFLLLLASFKAVYVFLLYGHSMVSSKLMNIQIGAIYLLVNLAIYMVFEQNIYLNTLYSVEALVLLWLSVRIQSNMLKYGSMLAMFVAVLSMFYAWYLTYSVYPEESVLPIINRGFWAALLNGAVIVGTIWFLKHEYEEERIAIMHKHGYISVLSTVLFIILYFGPLLDWTLQARHVIGGTDTRTILFFAYNMLFLLAAHFFIHKTNRIMGMRTSLEWGIAIVVLIYSIISIYSVSDLRDGFLDDHHDAWPYLIHYPILALMGYLVYLLTINIIRLDGYKSGKYAYSIQLACILLVWHTTLEYEHLFVIVSRWFVDHDIEDIVYRHRATSFTLLWVILAVGMMYFGMKVKIREIRRMALILLGLTAVKFFIVDFWRLEIVGKILAFLFIGVLLIVVSQLYRRKQLQTFIENGEIVIDKDAILTQDQAAALAKLQSLLKLQKKNGGK